MPMPRPDEASKAFFESIVPDGPRVQVRPMFGNVAGFVNGNMFTGLHGNDLFVRLSDADRAELLKEEGASIFDPMHGRPMKEYVVVPRDWREKRETVSDWVTRSLNWVSQMPEKKPKTRKKRGASRA